MALSDGFIRALEILLPNIAVIVGAVLLWRKSIKLLPRETRGADLNNQVTEVSLASQMQNVARNAAAQVLEYQQQLKCQDDEIEKLQIKLAEFEPVVKEVAQLKVDLQKYKDENDTLWEWANALQKQVREFTTPVPMPVNRKRKEP